MNIIDALVLGLTQGLTEFIPISSSGHLVLVERLLGGGADQFHLFLEFINVGTLLALLVFFRKKIWQILVDIFVKRKWNLARNILLTAIPAGLVGFFLASFIESSGFFSSVVTVAVALGLVGVVMIVLEKLPRASEVKDGERLPCHRAFIIGLAQVLALIPGVSRSGATIIAGRLNGLNAKAAAEYSFLASIPIMCGVVLKMLVSSSDRAYLAANWQMLALSNLAAFAAGLLAIGFLLRYLEKKRSLQIFGWYRVVLSAVILFVML